MKASLHSTTVFVAVSVLQFAYVNAFWRMSCGIIQVGRVDPVVSYGGVSNHVHKISGASNIGISSTYDTLVQSDCTSCTIQADKSAYWTPALYYLHANGSYEEVPNSGTTVYYLGRGSDPWGNTTANPFPPGLKMLSGVSNARTQDTTTMTWGNKTYPARLVSDAVSMVCINYEGATTTSTQTVNITNLNCPDGFRAQIQMQTCWDGQNLYLPNQAHVAHLSQIDNGICPPTHPVLLPHLFYEVFYSITPFSGGDGNFVFANGDMTGYGFHGDFINGWDIPTLTQAISKCLINNTNGVVEQCSVFDASNDPNSSRSCPERSPVFPCEPVKGLLTQLPGCITPIGYGGIVTSASITCPGGNSAACNSTATLPPTPWTGDTSYAPLGCYTEASHGRALSSDSYTSTTNMTATTCKAYCNGFQYFGVEYGQECYCGNSINDGSALTADSACGMSCTGDRFQICGAGNHLNVYQINATLLTHPGGSLYTSLGCYTEANHMRALSSKSYVDRVNMSVESCQAFCGTSYTYIGVEWSQECYCGNVLNAGSVPAPAGDCSNACSGNRFETCGGGSRLNIYQLKSASSSALPGSSTTTVATRGTSSSRTTRSGASSSSSIDSKTTSQAGTSTAKSSLSTNRTLVTSSTKASSKSTSSSSNKSTTSVVSSKTTATPPR